MRNGDDEKRGHLSDERRAREAHTEGDSVHEWRKMKI